MGRAPASHLHVARERRRARALVSIYSNAKYVSYDLDFVPIGLARKLDRAMESLGFVK